MIVLVTGDREWTDLALIADTLIRVSHSERGFIEGVTVINGGQGTKHDGIWKGADKLSTLAARTLGLQFREYPADWKRYRKGAGPIRNQQMLDSEPIDLVLAFHDDLSRSKGTKDMVERARKAGIPVEVIHH